MTDWLRSTNAERKALYKTAKAIADENAITVFALCMALFDLKANERSFQSNAVAGRMDRKHCAVLYRWIGQAHPASARVLNAELLKLGGGYAVWEAFMTEHSVAENVQIVLHDKASMGIVAFADIEGPSVTSVKRGATFSFRLRSPFDGFAMGFQATGSLWFPIMLTRTALVMPVLPGPQPLPIDQATGAVIPLSEDTDMGRHRFAFVFARDGLVFDSAELVTPGQAVDGAILQRLAERLGQSATEHWCLYHLPVLFMD